MTPEHLTPKEYATLRQRMLEHIDDRPARIRPTQIVHGFLQRGIAVVLLTLFPALMVAYVADKALPSHGWLYDIKRGGEEVVALLQPTPASRISYRSGQVARRVREVSVLSTASELEDLNMERLSRDIAAHISDIETSLQQAPGDAVLPAGETLATQLSTKQKVLETLLSTEQATERQGETMAQMMSASSQLSVGPRQDSATSSTLGSAPELETQDERDQEHLDQAKDMLGIMRIELREYIGDDTPLDATLAQSLSMIQENLENRYAAIARRENLDESSRNSLNALLVDLGAFIDLLQHSPGVARYFIPETDSALDQNSRSAVSSKDVPADQTVPPLQE